MKKVLILAYDFPPYVSVGGLRPNYWYENFKEMGLFPIVITRNWNPIHGNELDYIQPSDTNQLIIEENEKGILIKTPYKATLSNRLNLKGKKDKFSNLLKKISTGYNETGQWFLPIGTKYELYKAAKNYLKENKVDIILATGEPFILFKYASKLSKKFKIPWVADYRDPWSQSKRRSKNPLNKKINYLYEKKILKKVPLVTTVSLYFARKIESIYLPNKIEIISNGYNEQNFSQLKDDISYNQLLTISLAGTISVWHPYELFFQKLEEYLKANQKQIKLNFYGINNIELIKDSLEKHELLKNMVFIYPRLKNDELLKELKKSNLLLLFNVYTVLGTKIFDYLALNKKILFCFESEPLADELRDSLSRFMNIEGLKDNLQAELIRETNSGIIVKDNNHLTLVLDELFNEFEAKGFIENHTIGAEKYSRRLQTEKLVDLLKKTANND